MEWPPYEQWADAAVSIETRECPDFCLDIYVLPNGTHLRHDAVMPRYWGHKPYSRTMLCGIQLPKNASLPPGMELWDSYVAEDMGVPVFNDRDECPDSLKAAYEWARTQATT